MLSGGRVGGLGVMGGGGAVEPSLEDTGGVCVQVERKDGVVEQ